MTDSVAFKKRVDNMSILYVDDDQVITKIMHHLLNRFFTKTMIAHNGIDALKVYKKECPDLVITDIIMPAMNGFTLADKILEYNPNASIIFTSGQNDIEYLHKMEEYGGYCITKPLTKKSLFSTITEVLEKDLALMC